MKTKSFGKILKKVSLIVGITLILLVGGISATVYLMRDSLIQHAVGELNKQLQTPVEVKQIDVSFWGTFPKLSIDLEEVYVQEHAPHKAKPDTLLYAELIRLKFNAQDVYEGKYHVQALEINSGKVRVAEYANGVANYAMVKANKSDEQSAFQFALEKVEINGVFVSYFNEDLQQDHQTYLKNTELQGNFSDKRFDMHIASEVFVNKVKSGEVMYVKNQPAEWDLSMHIDKEAGTFKIDEAPVEIATLPFKFSFDSHGPAWKFHLTGDDLSLVKVVQSFQHKELDRIAELEGKGQVTFDLFMDRTDVEKSPVFTCDFGITDGHLREPSQGLAITNISAQGHCGNKETGDFILDLKKLKFRTRAGGFQAKGQFRNPAQPEISFDAFGSVDLSSVHALFPVEAIAHMKGMVRVDGGARIRYAGTWNLEYCRAKSTFMEASFQLKDDKRYFDHLTGDVTVYQNLLSFNGFSGTVGKSDMKIDGDMSFNAGLFAFDGPIDTQLKIRSAYCNIQDFSSSTKEEEIKDGRNFILPSNINGAVALMANNLVYDGHEFKQLSTQLKVRNRAVYFEDLQVKNAGAQIAGVVLIEENKPEIFTISAQAQSSNVQFKPLFAEWDNFQQDVISADQIEGVADAHINFQAPFDLRSGINMKAIVAEVNFSINNGRLKNLSSFKEITASLDKSVATRAILKRNNITHFEEQLKDLRFENITNTLQIREGALHIPQMMIATNAMDINLSGWHDFDNNIDYRFNFKFRDIRRVQTDTEFGEVIDDESGLQLFVRMLGHLDDPTIKWDGEARKALAKAKREEEKQTAKSILKTGFHLYQKDSTVQKFEQAKPQPKEKIEIIFDEDEKQNDTNSETIIAKDKPKRNGKIGTTLNKWKQQAQEEEKKKASFSLDGY